MAPRDLLPLNNRNISPQLVVGLVTCGIGAVVWGIIDAVLIFTDKVRDPEGRPLREGT